MQAEDARPLFVQFLLLKIDAAFRRLEEAERQAARRNFAKVLCNAAPAVTVFTYSTLGLTAQGELMLWLQCDAPELAQDLVARALRSGVGRWAEVTSVLFGLTRPSTYTKRPTAQEQAVFERERLRYLIVYPFVKTADWYTLSREIRQTYMNEHMRIGHDFADVRQVLLYSTGLADQEFVVAYETDRIERQHELVTSLRATASRAFTVRDTPIVTCVHRPVEQALALVG